MKVTTFILFILLSSQVFASEPNAGTHLVASGLFGAGATTMLFQNDELPLPPMHRIVLGGAIGLLPGIGKELYDASRSGGSFSSDDITMDAIGSFAGAALSEILWGSISFRADGNQMSLEFSRRF